MLSGRRMCCPDDGDRCRPSAKAGAVRAADSARTAKALSKCRGERRLDDRACDIRSCETEDEAYDALSR